MDKSTDQIPTGATTIRPNEMSNEATAPPAYEATPKEKPDDDNDSINSSIPPDSPGAGNGPDIDHPFYFPEPAPTYTESPKPTGNEDKLFAVPQTHPSPTASFVNAYPTALLAYGIPSSTWHSFVATVSSFLNASVSKHAVRHASKIAKTAGQVPMNLGKDLLDHTTGHAKNIGRSAKKGNLFGIVGSVIGWPVGVAGRLVGSVFELPASVMQRPETPRQRAEVYIVAANKKWFNPRGLYGLLLNSAELAELVGVSVDQFLGAAQGKPGTGEQLGALRKWVGELTVLDDAGTAQVGARSEGEGEADVAKGKQKAGASLRLGRDSLWLIVVQADQAPKPTKSRKR